MAYGDGASPPRNLSVFDGLQHVGSSSPGVIIPLSGFRTPSSGGCSMQAAPQPRSAPSWRGS